MKKTILNLILAAFILGSFQVQAGDDPSLVLVRSTYLDELTKRPIQFTGIGVLVSIPAPDRSFVLTSSHLSQGNDLELLSGGVKPLTPSHPGQARLADNWADLELIEVTGQSLSVLARWESTEGKFFLLPEKARNWFWEGNWFSRLFSSAPEFFRASSTFQGMITPLVTPRASWVQTPPEDFRASVPKSLRYVGLFGSGEVGELEQTLAQSELSIDAKTALGMSGSVLIHVNRGNPEGRAAKILGLSKSVSRKFSRSFFSKPEQIQKLVSAYLSGSRGRLGPAHWRVRNGLLYRDLGNDSLEISPLALPTGGGISSDGGNGIRSDGGFGPQEGMDPYLQFSIHEGMRWHGREVIGFRVHDSHPHHGLYFASLQSLDLFRLLGISEESFTTVESKSSIYSLVLERAKSYLSNRAEYDRKFFLSEAIAYRMIQNELRERFDPFTELDETLVTGCLVTLGRKFGIPRISVRLRNLFQFELSENGELLDSKNSSRGFRPIIEVQGKGTYAVDLRGLFSIDPSSIFLRLQSETSFLGDADQRSVNYLKHYQDRLTLRVEGGELGRSVNIRCDAQVEDANN